MTPYEQARKLAKYGRNGDTTLMHVQPHEIQAIAKLLGKPVTINPVTGLPEAFSWGKLLGGLGALAAAPFTGGTSLAFLAPVLASTGAALATSAFGSKKQGETSGQTAGRKYIEDMAQKQKEQYKIPLIRYGAAPSQEGKPPAGVGPEQWIAPIRQVSGWVSPGGQSGGFAEGGMIPEQQEAAAIWQAAEAALMGQAEDPEPILQRFVEVWGAEALQQLLAKVQQGGQPQQEAARGGMLKGPGGGMDDLMTARVKGGPQVALSGDEYVVPADAVSMLGDGSSDAGGRKLDAMVQRIRKQKTGRSMQAGKINDSRVMPR